MQAVRTAVRTWRDPAGTAALLAVLLMFALPPLGVSAVILWDTATKSPEDGRHVVRVLVVISTALLVLASAFVAAAPLWMGRITSPLLLAAGLLAGVLLRMAGVPIGVFASVAAVLLVVTSVQVLRAVPWEAWSGGRFLLATAAVDCGLLLATAGGLFADTLPG